MGTVMKLPPRVILPMCERLDAKALSLALGGASKAKLHLWRKRQGLPPSARDGPTTYSNTAEVAAWLTSHGVMIKWV